MLLYTYNLIGVKMKNLIDNTTLKIVDQLVDNNHHGEAYGLLAYALGLKDLAAKFKHICKIHEIEGHLEWKLYEYRYELIKQVHEYAKANANWNDIQAVL